MRQPIFAALVATATARFSARTSGNVSTQALSGVRIPAELAYLLPEGYEGDINANFIDTTTSNASINAILEAAREADFYAYDDEFYSNLGASPTIQTISSEHAHEAGIWVPNLNQVWFTGGGDDKLPYNIFDLETYAVKQPSNLSSQLPPVVSGGDLYDGVVYFGALGLKSISLPPTIFAVDSVTGAVSTVINSYGGVPLNSADDLSWVVPSADGLSCTEGAHLFFTTLDLGANGENQLSDAVLPNAVFRFTPSTKSLQAVISRGDVLAPNCIHADPNGRHIYVTDVALTSLTGPGSNSSGSPAIYKFDLDADCSPINKRLFAIPRSGYADGIKVDSFGRVWTAELNGIVVRNSKGRELGVFNGEQLTNSENGPIENFALAGDKLVMLAGDKILVVPLGQTVAVQR